LVGSAAFSGTAGELCSFGSNGSFFRAGDTNGDAVAEFLIKTNVLIHSSDVYLI
jgi:serralysin